MPKHIFLFIMATLSLFACNKKPQTFTYQESGYALAAVDSLINETYEVRQLDFPDDYEGKVIATLLKKQAADTSRKAILYIHGYGEYFFQDHVGKWFNEQGYNFYALELRKYGRSLLPHQKASYTKKLEEYYPEISEAIRIIKEEDKNEYLLLNGHSTGGLTGSLYTAEGERKDDIDALLLNSPFLEFRASYWEKLALKTFGSWSRMNPSSIIPLESEGLYGQSLHKDYQGDWDYNFVWKPIEGFPLYAAWIRAVHKGHKQVQKGLDISIPILLLRSDKSHLPVTFTEDLMNSDAVLNVEHMKNYGPMLGDQVQIEAIENGMHDIFLSNATARAQAFQKVKLWLEDLHTR